MTPPHPRHTGAEPEPDTESDAQRESRRRKNSTRVLFISELPCRAAARRQLAEAVGHHVEPVQRPAAQLLVNPRLARGYAVAVVHQAAFDQHSRVLCELLRAGVTTVLVPRYQAAADVQGETLPKVVGYQPLRIPALQSTTDLASRWD